MRLEHLLSGARKATVKRSGEVTPAGDRGVTPKFMRKYMQRNRDRQAYLKSLRSVSRKIYRNDITCAGLPVRGSMEKHAGN